MLDRRTLVLGLTAATVSGRASAAAVLPVTPQEMLGPFYPEHPLPDHDFDLTRIQGQRAGTRRSHRTGRSGVASRRDGGCECHGRDLASKCSRQVPASERHQQRSHRSRLPGLCQTPQREGRQVPPDHGQARRLPRPDRNASAARPFRRAKQQLQAIGANVFSGRTAQRGRPVALDPPGAPPEPGARDGAQGRWISWVEAFPL